MRFALPIVLIALALSGCKSGRDKDVLGAWSGNGTSVTIEEAKTFKSSTGPMTIEGRWSLDGNDLTLTPKSLNGKPIAELKAQFQKNLASVPAAAKAFVENLDKPNVLTLSDDGKTLLTNKSKDKNPGPGMSLTKG